MHDDALARHRQGMATAPDPAGWVDQRRTASRLFAGDYTASTTAGEEFGGSRLGVGVMEGLDGEIVSIHGATWRVPVDGVPVPVSAEETIAFGVAAHGGRQHRFTLHSGADMDGILRTIDAYLHRTHVDHEKVVCAVEIVGDFTDVVLRTVAPPTHEGESLGEVIEHETRFAFPTWTGTLVGFRFPDATTGQTIPGLHLHGLAEDAGSGGHVRNATTGTVQARLWVDHLHPVLEADGDIVTGGATDFSRYEGPVD